MLKSRHRSILMLLLLPMYTIAQNWDTKRHVFDEVTGMYQLKNFTAEKHLQSERSNPLANQINQDTLRTSKIIRFDFTLIDTTQFENLFLEIGKIPIYGRSTKPLVFDSNNNGLDEVIGMFWDSDAPLTGVTQFYELNLQTNSFELVHDFGLKLVDGGGLQRLGGDLDADGRPEVYLQYGDSLRVYESINSSYAVHLKEVIHPVIPVTSAGYYSGDFDKDNLQELMYFRQLNSTYPQIAMFREQNPESPNLTVTDEVFYPGWAMGPTFAVGDFDSDGYIEFFTTNIYGDVFGIENVKNDSFSVHFWGNIETTNGKNSLGTNDLDGDGRPEIYLSGSYNGLRKYVHRIVVLEANGNNSYEASHYLEFTPGAGSPPMLTGDVDGDGVEELLFAVDGGVAVFKVTGNDTYELFWYKRAPFTRTFGVGDVDGDNIDEIVFSQNIYENNRSYSQSTIYKFDPTSVSIDIDQNLVPQRIELAQNYPNPFNPTTQIRFNLPRATVASIDVLNVRGQQVEELFNKKLPAGEHQVEWNGTNLPSGVYFYRLRAAGQSQVKKMLLLK